MTHPMIEEAVRAALKSEGWSASSIAEMERTKDNDWKVAVKFAITSCRIAIKACENNQQGIVDAEEGLLAMYNEKDFDMETKTLQFTRVTSAKQALFSLRALSEQIGTE